jgi:protocatechuate 3,4-dioxygenase beta subunit
MKDDVKAPRYTTRRQVLEVLGAIAATTACGSGSDGPGNNVGATGTAGTSSSGGALASASGGSTGSSGGMTSMAGATASAGGTGASGGTATSGGGTGAGGTGANVGGGGTSSMGGATGSGGSGGGGVPDPPAWDMVPMCTASKTDGAGQGPFFIHELEKDNDISLIRQDIRGKYNPMALDGVEMHLHLRVLDATSTDCNGKPVPDVDVYIWHTDAQGYYSGFGTHGGMDEQKPDEPYSGTPNKDALENTDRFCRGLQTTNKDGVVSFKTFFPGWYNGRDLHIHFVAFKKGSMPLATRDNYSKANSMGTWLFTTQFYFDPAFSMKIHEANEPYLTRTKLSAYKGAMQADENGNSGLHAKATLAGDTDGKGGIVTAQMQILLNPA